jgi:signal transduction histidine kinase
MRLLSRLLVLVIGVVILVLALVGVLVLTSLESFYLRERQVAYLSQASVVGGLALETLREGPPDSIGLVRLGQIAGDYGRQLGLRVLILDPAGVVLADTFADPRMLGSTLRHPEVLSALSGQATAAQHYLSDAGWVMYATSPVFVVRRVVGAVLVSASINDVYRSLMEIARRLAYVGALSLVIAFLVSYILARSMARPIAGLSNATRRMAKGDFGVRVPAGGATELARLGQDFNTMAERLDQLEEARRVFVADASHELRTPLSALKALIEPLIGEHSGRVEEATRSEFLRDMAAEVDRLDRLAGDLLDLAQLDESGQFRRARVSPANLAREVVERMAPVAESSGVRLEALDLGAPVVEVNELRMGQALQNLVDNAIKFTPPGGSVTVTTRGDRGASAAIEVRDTGVGIPAEDIPHVFERFYRVDPARSRGRGGTGLGLAIVKRIVELHGGRIDILSKSGEGSIFRIILGGPGG